MAKTIIAYHHEKNILILLALICQINAIAQLDINSRNKVERAISSHINSIGSDLLSKPSFKNKAFVVGILIGVNSVGKVDAVEFSNTTKELDSLISFRTVEKELKKISGLDAYKNSVILEIVYFRRSWDKSIDNFYDAYQHRQNKNLPDFDTAITNLIPEIPASLKGRKIVLFPVLSLVKVKPVH